MERDIKATNQKLDTLIKEISGPSFDDSWTLLKRLKDDKRRLETASKTSTDGLAALEQSRATLEQARQRIAKLDADHLVLAAKGGIDSPALLERPRTSAGDYRLRRPLDGGAGLAGGAGRRSDLAQLTVRGQSGRLHPWWVRRRLPPDL